MCESVTLLASLFASCLRADMDVLVTAGLLLYSLMTSRSSSTPPWLAMSWQISSVTDTRRSAEQAAAARGAASVLARRRTDSRLPAAPLAQISLAFLKAPDVRQGRSSSATVTLRRAVQAAISVGMPASVSLNAAKMTSSPPFVMKLAYRQMGHSNL